MAEINMNAVTQHLGQISMLGSHLGGKYFKVSAKETWTDFNNAKRAVELNPNAPDFILNRSPRKFEIRDFDVLTQTIKTALDGTTSVVFNPGTDTEAEAAIVAGQNGFGQTTDEALRDALTGGQKRIFANGPLLLNKVNQLNQNEIDRLTALKKAIQQQIDSLISTMKGNEKKVNDYEENLRRSAVKPSTDSSGSVSIVVEKAD